jgi:hypothetical protein
VDRSDALSVQHLTERELGADVFVARSDEGEEEVLELDRDTKPYFE